MPLKSVALIGLLGAAAGWLVATALSPEPQAPVAVRSGPRPLGKAEPAAPLTTQLQLKLREQPPAPVAARNPFTFGARSRAFDPAPARSERGDAPPDAATAAPMPAPMPAPVAGPRFGLSGIASNQRDGATTRTAILTDHGTIVLAVAGDSLPGGYRVLRVEENAAVLADAAGVELTLRLK